VLSGGVFQNKVLVTQLIEEFEKIDRKYYIQNKIAVNDGGISLGQIYYALNNSEG
jgi:hydrogenase maturation protein HypF